MLIWLLNGYSAVWSLTGIIELAFAAAAYVWFPLVSCAITFFSAILHRIADGNYKQFLIMILLAALCLICGWQFNTIGVLLAYFIFYELGYVISDLESRLINKYKRVIVYIFGTVYLAFAVVLIRNEWDIFTYWVKLLLGVPFVIAFCFSMPSFNMKSNGLTEALQKFGKISFQIYIIHIAIKSLLQFNESPLPIITELPILSTVIYFTIFTFAPVGIIQMWDIRENVRGRGAI